MTFRWRAAHAAVATSLAALLLAAAPAAWAQNVIQSISSTQQAGSEVVRIEPGAAGRGAGRLLDPAAAAHRHRPAGRRQREGRNSVDVNVGNLRSVSVAQAGDRTRLVLNLKQASGYRAQLQGRAARGARRCRRWHTCSRSRPQRQRRKPGRRRSSRLRRTPRRRAWCATSTSAAVPTAPAASSSTCRATRSASTSASRARTSSSSSCASTLPDNLRRRLDVTDFGTPVRSISTFQSGDRGCMVVEPTGAWEHSAYQTDTQFVLEVRPMKVDPNKLTQGPGFQGEKLSLNFQNISGARLQVIADFTNFNVVTSDTVTGSVTLRLKDVPWDQALDIILAEQGPGRAQERQRAVGGAQGRTGCQGAGRPSRRARRSPSSSDARAVVPAQLPQGRRGAQSALGLTPAAVRQRPAARPAASLRG
ncbi:MAG: hypothetical protein U1F25_01940 [Rubrivivax sp.]